MGVKKPTKRNKRTKTKEKDLLNCKYKVTFQPNGHAEPTCAETFYSFWFQPFWFRSFYSFWFQPFWFQPPAFEMYVCGVLFVCLFIDFACELILNVLIKSEGISVYNTSISYLIFTC